MSLVGGLEGGGGGGEGIGLVVVVLSKAITMGFDSSDLGVSVDNKKWEHR